MTHFWGVKNILDSVGMGPMDNGPVKIKKINSIIVCNTTLSCAQATLNGGRGWQVKKVHFFALNMQV